MKRSALAGAALALLALSARGAEPVPEDPPLCREALAARPDESALDALSHAEQDLATRARKKRSEAGKILREHRADGPRGGLAAADAAEPLLRDAAELGRAGKAICHCRQRRGDPNRESCEFLYPEKLP